MECFRCIIVSETHAGRVSLPESPGCPVFIERDVIKMVYNLLREKKGPIHVLFFTSMEEAFSLEEVFKGSDRVSYRVTVLLGGSREEDALPYSEQILTVRVSPIAERECRYLVDRAFAELDRNDADRKKDTSTTLTYLDALNDQEALIRIGKMLSLEKNSEKLLRTILYLSKKITGADAGSIFLCDTGPEGEEILRFRYSHTFSKDLAYEEFTMPLDKSSIAGYVAVTGKVINMPDVYCLPADSPISFNSSYDLSSGYRTKSMLVVPMRGNMDRIIGVIQLINSKEIQGASTGNEAYEVVLETPDDFAGKVVPFETRYEPLMEAVAGQAAIALENNRMLKQIEQQFDEFVKASVTAIESRDPATSGHSARVASLCVRIARVLTERSNGTDTGYSLSETQLKELELAGLLHDFGKVYIDERVFQKAKKLFEHDFDCLMMRLNFLYRSIQLQYGERDGRLAALEGIRKTIIDLNEPAVQQEHYEERLRSIIDSTNLLACDDLCGLPIPLLTEKEIVNLSIKRGSLNAEERKVIESHVEHTYTFVSKIPWPPEYRDIPKITMGHHEKLDGSGYPRGVSGKENIPLQARIMAVADIYDALVASDRPYKKAVPPDRVESILRMEASEGKLDPEIVDALFTGVIHSS